MALNGSASHSPARRGAPVTVAATTTQGLVNGHGLASHAPSVALKAPASVVKRVRACSQCSTLQEQLQLAQAEVQLLREALADACQRADALFCAFPSGPTTAAPSLPKAPREPLPLRYTLADAANQRIKRTLWPVHRALRQLTNLWLAAKP